MLASGQHLGHAGVRLFGGHRIGRLAEAVAANSHLAANRTPELYREIRKAWEPIDHPKLVIDTDTDLELSVDRALRYLTAQTFLT